MNYLLPIVVLGACGDDSATPMVDARAIDAPSPDAAAPDAPPDGAPACARLIGGVDVTTQAGWSIVQQGPATLTYGGGETSIQTTTTSGATSGGQLLLVRDAAVPTDGAFSVEVELAVDTFGTHNASDAPIAIMGSIAGNAGNPTDRGQMIYVDSNQIGWADDTQSATISNGGHLPHVYRLEVDAAKVATVSVDGVPVLARANFTTNGRIAIGDQTNDPNVDATFRIRSVTNCP